MPKGADRLPLSKMNMAGLGQKLIKSVMKKHNALSLLQLIDGVEFAGVGAYLADATDGKVNLFI